MSCVSVLVMGNSGDGCDLVSILRKYDLRKGDLFVLKDTGIRTRERDVDALSMFPAGVMRMV